MANLSMLKAAKLALQLKPLDAVVFLAPESTPVPQAFTNETAELQALPPAFRSVGLISKKDAIAFARDIQTESLDSFGELESTRMDVTSDVTSMSFTPFETNKVTLALASKADLDNVRGDASSGEVFFAQPTAPQIVYYTAIVIGRDGSEAQPIYIARVMPRVAVTKADGENWATGAHQKLTLTAFKDSSVGYAVGFGFFGAGWKKILEAAGFDYAATTIKITPATLNLTAGSPASAPLVVKNEAGTVISNSRVAFTSSDPTKATVSAAGVVTRVATGSATITATYLGKTDTCVATLA